MFDSQRTVKIITIITDFIQTALSFSNFVLEDYEAMMAEAEASLEADWLFITPSPIRRAARSCVISNSRQRLSSRAFYQRKNNTT